MKKRATLTQYGFLSVKGRDAVKFLQGYTTCDVERMTNDTARLGAICNIQGRMVASALIVRTPDGLLLRMSRDLIEPVMVFLKKYIVFSKAEMADLSQEMTCYGTTEDGVATSAPGTVALLDQGYVIRIDDNRSELWSGSHDLPEAEPGEISDWLLADIETGIAWVSAATTEAFIPQMFDYHEIGGIDFDKGCYLGQEIVARMQYRGKVNRKLFRGDGAAHAVGDTVTQGDKPTGTVIAASGQAFLAVVQNKDDSVPEIDGAALSTIPRN